MDFVKGQFRMYRVMTRIHLGGIGENLEKEEVIEFDGFVLRRNGKEHEMPSLRGTLTAGWIVPASDVTSTYKPVAAGITIGNAVSNSENRNLRTSQMMIHDDERDVGSLTAVRGAKAPPLHESKNSGAQVKRASSEAEASSEGVVVGRFKTSAVSGPIEVGKNDRSVVHSLDMKSKVEIERVVIARTSKDAATVQVSGDVTTARVGNSLEELLPDAVVTTKIAHGKAGEGRGDESEFRAQAVVSGGGASSTGGAEQGVVIGKAVHKDAPSVQAEDENLPEFEWPEHWLKLRELRMEVIRFFIPHFEWSHTLSKKTRAQKAVDEHGSDSHYMMGILAIETPDVREQINSLWNPLDYV